MKPKASIPQLFFALAFLVMSLTTKAQDNEQKSSFSVQEAIDYALNHNQNHLNAKMDVEIAEYRNKEYTGIGLPQINGSADVKDYLSIPTSLIPGEFFGGAPGTFIPVKFGTQYNAQIGVSASQIIFNSDYILGLKAAKEFSSLASKNLKRSKVETQVAITKAYYTALITAERLKIITANIDRVKKLFDDTKAMNAAGFAEKLDVDRLELTYNSLLTEKEKLERFVEFSKNLLKFQMAYEIEKDIVLTDEITPDLMINIDVLSENKMNYDLRPDYDALKSQFNINTLELKRNRYQYLPSLNAYGSMMAQAQRTKFDLFNIDQPWFNIALVGVTLNVPIFSGGQKHFKIEQSKLNLTKTSNTLDFVKNSIDIEVANSTMQYKNALASLETQRKNKELAKNIFETSEVKYNAGVGTNLDVIYAQAAYREAEINFLGAIYDLIIAKTDYLKATGTLVK